MWNFPTYIDFPELSGFGFLNVHVKILSFADEHKVLLRDVFKMGHTYNDIPENLRIGAAFYCLKSSFLVLCRESWHIKKTLRQPFFISPFLPDDVIRAPDLRLAVAATCCTSEALPHFIWAFATT